MAGCVYGVTGPTGFLVGFVISEIIALISTFKMEGLRMVNKLLEMKLRSFVKCTKKFVITSWEARLAYRHSLLMSL